MTATRSGTPPASAVLVNWRPQRDFVFTDVLGRELGTPCATIGAGFPPSMSGMRGVYARVLYVGVAVKALVRRPPFERAICWQQASGIALSLLQRLLGVRRSLGVYVMMFIVSPRKRRRPWRDVIGYAIESASVRAVVCYSEAEREAYRRLFPRAAHKLHVLRFSEDLGPSALARRRNDGFLLAAGRSNRDHDFLVRYAAARPHVQLVIVCDTLALRALPPNVRVLRDAFGDAYLEILGACHAVLLAFRDTTMSAGQLVFLQAMQLGKPVIATRSDCLEGYLVDGRNGLEIEKTEAALDHALARLADPHYYETLAACQIVDYRERFGTARLAEAMALLVRESEAGLRAARTPSADGSGSPA